ncbi:MAG: phosphoribosylamine--glycine ligase [Clostridiales bacterium]|jgi:phosphoribosylamine--glycine ligase|nr:phosphoribosylamine--glycine ligase [Clostridiales bacterium]
MNILVVGGGGREHAICHKLSQSASAEKIYCAPGNFGISRHAETVDIDSKSFAELIAFAAEKSVDLAVIGPDGPLADGLSDAFNEAGIKCFGPTKDAARIESSKAFAKGLMSKYGIPTAGYRVFDNFDSAAAYAGTAAMPLVVKASGLALGKGVVVCRTADEAREALGDMFLGGKFGESGKTVVAEEFLSGPEVSVLAFCDGETIAPMISARDHKRALDGDLGPNTGGMGAVAPCPYYTEEMAERVEREIISPTMAALAAEGIRFVGVIYFGIILTESGPKLLEYNARFGDPETQAVLPLLEGDLAEIMLACVEGRLDRADVRFSGQSAAAVVLASGGYPGGYGKGYPITGIGDAERIPGVTVYSAGVAGRRGLPVTDGGRVLGVTATGGSLTEAIKKAYAAAGKIEFTDMFHRRDIGGRL